MATVTKKTAAKTRLTRSGAAGSVMPADIETVKEAIEPKKRAAATNGVIVEDGRRDAPAKGRPGRKSKAQQRDEVLARLIEDPAERGAAMDQLALAELADKLVALRNDAGLSQRDLADKIGSHQPDVGKIERGQSTSVASLQRYVRGLGGKLVISIER